MRTLRKLNQEDLLFFDIETARVAKELELDTPLFDSWAYKVNKDGKKTNQEIIDSYRTEAALYPEFAKIISIVVGKIVDGGITLITFDNPSEKVLLAEFNSLLKRRVKDTLVGFVNTGFDSPFIFKRMLINGILPHDKIDSSGLKPWEVDEIDLSKEWQGTSFNRASLINIATAFDLPSPKDDIGGADVGRVYYEEENGLSRISKYCRKDVATTINVFRKMCLQDPLEVTNGGDFEDEPLIVNLFNGGDYGKEEKGKLVTFLKGLDTDEREKVYEVLNGLISSASGKKTKFQKAHLKTLKEIKYEQ